MSSYPLLSAKGITKSYRTNAGGTVALNDVSLEVSAGKTLGLVGPSGSGKSTLARILLRLTEPDSGKIDFGGTNFLSLRGGQLRKMRRRIQMVFQEPLGAFNPRATVGGALADPLRLHGIAQRAERPAAIARLLERVGLDPSLASRSIREISGGQRQRVAIARAIATGPQLIVFDESVSALDASVRAKILRLLVDLQREKNIAYVFISHDLAVVRAVSHQIAIMDSGRIVEHGPARQIIEHPQSTTGRALVEAVPRLVADNKRSEI